MCNLYSITTNQEAIIRLFRVQAVWKRFSSPTQPGAMGLDATV